MRPEIRVHALHKILAIMISHFLLTKSAVTPPKMPNTANENVNATPVKIP